MDEAERLDQASRNLHDNGSETARATGGDFLVPHCMLSPHRSLGPVTRVETPLQGEAYSFAYSYYLRAFKVLRRSDISIGGNLSSITGLKVL